MSEKFTFEKKLGIDSSEKKYQGLKVITIAFLVAMSGALIAFLGAIDFGRAVIIVGTLGGFVGMLMHFTAMLRQEKKK